MIDPRILAGWERVLCGDGVALVPPAGYTSGHLRVRPRLTPPRSVRDVFRSLTGTVTGPVGLITAEGEFGAFASAVAGDEHRAMAMILGDDHYAVIEGMTRVPADAELIAGAVRKLAIGHCLGLGSDRWRRFLYRPPPGWTPVTRSFATSWMAPSCPRVHRTITVFDARPVRAGRSALIRQHLFESLPAGFAEGPPSPPVHLRMRDGLVAQLVTYRGRIPGRDEPAVARNAVILDARYLYPFRLECDAAIQPEADETFRAVVSSMRPLPPSRIEETNVAGPWVE